ncbi:putative aminotransferase [Methanocella paludicola SANAE]|uniref:Aminotransferase n=1 Tax=Methanocella paludicola (strain DSM 17711 / JCM 13418 / NBRC 101707 / SANAE) TaxID=304371 RepID=D1YWV3_METPS|nr:DegT/DnrJ/EryC1/StrS family aminotransferase [Methanocella paludicola]BAI60925.1 putative aminotransferase [Methanocella paludicola SANAE]
MIPIAKPLIGQEEIDAVMGVMRSGTIAEGPKTKEFEDAFKAYIGAGHAIAVNSGTAALHVALLAKGIGPGDEVITTPFTFIATANSILFTGAKPVFVDIEPDTFNIDVNRIRDKITKRTKAVIPVDLYGHCAEMKAIMDIAEDHGLAVIEDACQAHGASVDGKKAGSFDIGCFSFYPTKNMTTSEGGMITCNDDDVAEKARMIKSHGSKVRYYHEMLGYNLRMTDISAAIGLAQLKKVDRFNEARIRNAMLLSEKLKDIPGIVTPAIKPGYKHVFHQYTIRVTDEAKLGRDELMGELNHACIGNSIYYPLPIHQQPSFRNIVNGNRYPVSELMSKQVISLPVHPSVTADEIQFMADNIRVVLT